MSGEPADPAAEGNEARLVLDYGFSHPPEKLWRAVSLPDLREAWLPAGDLAHPEPVIVSPGEELTYRMRDTAPPHRESLVILRVVPDGEGGSRLRIVHAPAHNAHAVPKPANGNLVMAARAA